MAGILSDAMARGDHVLDLRRVVVCTFMLSYPPTDYVVHGVNGRSRFSTRDGPGPFVITIFVLGFFMSLGKAAVYKHIPVYYPNHVGAVGGWSA
jgi:NNP family nitrate/nitrite transporter-like MFS transporter